MTLTFISTPAPKMNMKATVFAFLALFSVAYCNETDDPARLLIAKQILNRYLVEDMDILVKYFFQNIGGSAALQISLKDNSFPQELFTIAGGQLNVVLDRIPPFSNVTHVVVVRPKKYGMYNFTAAEVSYKSSESASSLQWAVTSEPGEGMVIPFKDFNKKFSPHLFDWFFFGLMSLPCVGLPFLLWYSSKSKYPIFGVNTKAAAKKPKAK
ncbi:unnamed protein product [Bemisia tabaci]|uniref:Translocon-associated protein subunit beta n=1 Tax=Bemisia tabaci TaxID=7038 RepID=A0A9P0A8W0_BEMTA|nr:unnamed protein product [Bemisia tabaci]